MLVPPFNGQDLLDDFFGAEVAFPSIEAAGAEFATVGAADLRRSAQGLAVAGLAVEGRTGRDEHALDQRVVSQAPEKFLSGIPRTLLAHQLQRVERVMIPKQIAQGFRQIGHRVPIRNPVDIEPLQQLRDAVGGLAPGLKPGLQLFEIL